MKRILVVAFLASSLNLLLSGCSKDKDPGAPVDAPGYYNGPMKPRGGGGAKGADAEAKGPETGS